VVRRSVGVVEAEDAGERLVEGPTKTGRSRVVDLDSGTVAALRAHRAVRGLPALDLVRDSALVLSNLDGTSRHPERFSRRFAGQVAQARKALGEEQLPVIRLHDLVAGERDRGAGMAEALRDGTLAWAARRPTASARCSRADVRRAVSRGPQRPRISTDPRALTKRR
jgi:hypothetical protein